MSISILLVHPDGAARKAIRTLLSTQDVRLTEKSHDLGLRELGVPDLVLIAWQALNPTSESLRWLRQSAGAKPLRVIVLSDRATVVDDRLTAGPIMLDRRVHRVSVNDENIELAPTEFRLLAFLLENQGRVFSRNELLTRAWSSNIKAGHRTVDVHVRRLRQQLEPFCCAEMIQTVRGFGYRLRADSPAANG